MEMALAMVIMGLILGSITTMLAAMARSSEQKETREKLALARDRIVGYVASNRRLQDMRREQEQTS